jgi:hypothetical protein
VTGRFVLVLVAYVFWVLLVVLTTMVHTQSAEIVVTPFRGASRTVISASRTLAALDPGPVRTILVGSLVCVLTATWSVAWRIARRSATLGVAGLVAGCVVGATALVAILTVGPLLVPLAAVLIVLALPMSRLGEPPGT